MNIFTKFNKDWTTIVDFLLKAKYLASANNFGTPSSIVSYKNVLRVQTFYSWKVAELPDNIEFHSSLD